MVVRLKLSVGIFDIVSLMKGHVGDGAWSGGLWAPVSSLNKPMSDMSFVSITFDSAGIGS